MPQIINQQQILEILISSYGYVGLFIFGAIATTIIPLSPEIAALAVWKIGAPVIPTTIILTLGNYAGNALNYWVGYSGGFWVLKNFFSTKKKRLDMAHNMFSKYGPPILLFSWLPIIGDPLTFVPGVLRYSFKKFTIYVVIGKIIRYIVLYYLFAWWM